MNTEHRRWFSVAEVAAFLNCHPQTVYGWIDSGRLKAARVGRRFVRVDLKALEADLEKQTLNRPLAGRSTGRRG